MKTTAPFFNDKWLKRHMQVTIHVDRLAAAIWALSSGQDGYKHRLEWLFSFRFTKMLRDMELPPFGQHMLERDPWPKIDSAPSNSCNWTCRWLQPGSGNHLFTDGTLPYYQYLASKFAKVRVPCKGWKRTRPTGSNSMSKIMILKQIGDCKIQRLPIWSYKTTVDELLHFDQIIKCYKQYQNCELRTHQNASHAYGRAKQ